MFKVDKDIIKGIWSKMWIAALLLYVSYFFYRWIGVYISRLLGEIADLLLYQGAIVEHDLVWKVSITFLFAIILMPMIDLFTNVIIFRQGLKYEASVIDAVLKKDFEAFQMWQANEWMGRIAGDSLQYRQMAVITPTRLFADITVFIAAMITFLQTDIFLAFILIVGIWISVMLQFACRKKSNYFLEENRKYQDEKRVSQIEMARDHSLWISYGCKETLPMKMENRFKLFFKKNKQKELFLSASLDLYQRGIFLGLFVISLIFGLKQVEVGKMSAGSFVTIYFLIMQVKNMAENIITNLQILRGYGAQEERISSLVRGAEANGKHSVSEWHELYFHKVSYCYPKSRGGMQERDFVIKCGEFIQLEGYNGSGKTTLLKLLCGLLSSRNPQIRLDNIDFSELNLVEWRDRISYMQQFPDIFPGTVRENVFIGNLSSTQEQVDMVLDKVGLMEMANRHLNGAKDELSGGEIKRIELGRILLRLGQCDLIMLDEPFENLDEFGKVLVREILTCTSKARILVSHRSL